MQKVNYFLAPGIKKMPDYRQDTFQKVTSTIISYFNLPEDKFFSKNRKPLYCNARFICFTILHKEYKFDKLVIGRKFGMHWASVINGINKCDNFYQTEPLFRNDYDTIYSKL